MLHVDDEKHLGPLWQAVELHKRESKIYEPILNIGATSKCQDYGRLVTVIADIALDT
jgi:hypothetical protein